MGVDLTLLIAGYELRDRLVCHDMISLDRDSVIFKSVEDSDLTVPVDRPVTCYLAESPDGQVGYGMTAEDKYGVPLMQIHAGDLSDILSKHVLGGNNRWIHEALRAMDLDQKIVLFWR